MHNISLSHIPTSNLQVFKNLSNRDISFYFLLTLPTLSHHHPHLTYLSALQTVLSDPLLGPSTICYCQSNLLKIKNQVKLPLCDKFFEGFLLVFRIRPQPCYGSQGLVWYGARPFPSPFSLLSFSRFSSLKCHVLPHLKAFAHAISLPGKMFSSYFAWLNLMNLNFRAHWNIPSSERHSVSPKLDLASYIYVLITSSWTHSFGHKPMGLTLHNASF